MTSRDENRKTAPSGAVFLCVRQNQTAEKQGDAAQNCLKRTQADMHQIVDPYASNSRGRSPEPHANSRHAEEKHSPAIPRCQLKT